MNKSSQRPHGFTVVELLVVVAVIGLLVGLLMPALSGVKKRSKKANELNDLRQIGLAWQMYSSSNNESILPGFLEPEVQDRPNSLARGWGVEYKFPDSSPIPPYDKNGFDNGLENLAGPWTWRLLSYLDYSHDVVHRYAIETEQDFLVKRDPEEDKAVAYEPAFGYNGYYVGGYWTMDSNDVQRPKVKFLNQCEIGTYNRLSIPQKVSHIARPAELFTFCSSTRYTEGLYEQRHAGHDVPGAHLVAPPVIGVDTHWRAGQMTYGESMGGERRGFGPTTVIVEDVSSDEPSYVPLGRYTGSVAILFADGHVDTNTIGSMIDQRNWIDGADRHNYTHEVCGGEE